MGVGGVLLFHQTFDLGVDSLFFILSFFFFTRQEFHFTAVPEGFTRRREPGWLLVPRARVETERSSEK